MTLAVDALNAKWNEWVLGYGPENQNKFMQWLGMRDPSWRKMILTMIAIVFSLIAVISILLALRYRAPAKDPAAILFQRFAKKTGLEQEVGETPARFADRARLANSLPASVIDSVTEAYHEARYGPAGPAAFVRLKNTVNAIN